MMPKQTMIALGLVAAGLAYAAYKAAQPNVGLLKLTVRGNIAYGNGYTDSRSLGQITKALDENPQIDTLVLAKMSGTRDADLNVRLARRIRKRGLNTHLTSNSYIASGAVDLFLAGVERTMECGAAIGVHSWSVGGVRETVRISPNDIGWDDRQKYQEKFLIDMGIDPSFYAFTRSASEPESVHIMSPEEINRFGLLTQPVDCD